MKKCNNKILLIILILASVISNAQSDRYWSTTFNTEASILAGAVVGGGSDITSLYYNPAGISEIKDKKLVLNANLFRFDYELYNNIPDKNQKIKEFETRVQPRFISYTYQSKLVKKLSWQFALFNRDIDKKSFTSFHKTNSKYISENTGEQTSKNYDYFNEYNDYWGGLGAAYQVNDKLSIGLGTFISVKNTHYTVYKYIKIEADKNTIPDSLNYYDITTDSYEKVKFYDSRILWKIGIRYKIKKFSFGLNITTPSLKIMGKAESKRRESLITYSLTDYNSYHLEENSRYRKTQIKDPFSLAFGIVYSVNEKISTYFSTEYFHEIPTYILVDGTEQVDWSSEDYEQGTEFTSYKYGTKSIINYAFGFKNKLNENFDLMFGFRTDFNAYKISENESLTHINEISKIHYNLYHFTLGSNFNFKKTSFLLGFGYSYGNNKNADEYNDGNQYLDNIFGVNNKNVEYTINSMGLYLGFSINL